MKDNKLIAEFMGIRYEENKNSHESSWAYYEDCELEYHTSWDWLMPVVEKCYESGAEENEVGDITHALLDCDRKETYNAVVEFIKELNRKDHE